MDYSKKNLLASMEDKYSRYKKGDYSDFAAAHEILVTMISVGYLPVEEESEERPSVKEYLRILEILLDFAQKEPKSSPLFYHKDGWESFSIDFNPLDERCVLGYWFNLFLNQQLPRAAIRFYSKRYL